MSMLMQILNLYATRESQTKFEANCMKNGKVTVMTYEARGRGRERGGGGGGGGRGIM